MTTELAALEGLLYCFFVVVFFIINFLNLHAMRTYMFRLQISARLEANFEGNKVTRHMIN